jgi:hypothetical protein
MPAIVDEHRRFIRHRGKAVAIETGNDTSMIGIMKNWDNEELG